METEIINNEQEAIQEVSEETNEETTTEGTNDEIVDTENNSSIGEVTTISSSDETSSESSDTVDQGNTEEQAPNETPGETTQEVESPGEFSTLLIEEKLDNIIALETQQVSTSLICVAVFSAVIVIILLYKFITNFFEF